MKSLTKFIEIIPLVLVMEVLKSLKARPYINKITKYDNSSRRHRLWNILTNTQINNIGV